MTKQPVFRFAPSPNGRLHLGHAYSALLNAELARRCGGRLLLRIEDIDTARCRPELEAAIYEDLAWLGLRWETPVRRQSEHLDDYAAAFASLKERDLVYPCFCSRGDIARNLAGREEPRRDPDGALLYPGTCKGLDTGEARRRMGSGEPHAWRLSLKRALAVATPAPGYSRFAIEGGTAVVAARPQRWGDAVIVRKEISTSYHLSVVVDDALQGVTHVVRGRDLEAATDLHVLLQALLALPCPLYHHHELIRDHAGDKLSKSLKSPPLAGLRAQGITADEVLCRLGF